MADYEMGRKAGIGSSSLILVFIVLCLVTFGMLSIGNAKREDALSEKNAQAVQAYYRADSQGEAFVAEVAGALCDADSKDQALEAVGDYYHADTDMLCAEIPMEHGQALRVELKPDWEAGTYQVTAWNVYEREAYEIDQSVKVWTGGES